MEAAHAVEEQVDTELNRLEKLTENDIEKMRAQRLESMKQDHKNVLLMKFVKLNVDHAPFITECLNIKILPTIALLIDNIAKDKIIGFTDLGNHDEFSTNILEWRLEKGGVIDYKGDLTSPSDEKEKRKMIHLYGKKPKTIRNAINDD